MIMAAHGRIGCFVRLGCPSSASVKCIVYIRGEAHLSLALHCFVESLWYKFLDWTRDWTVGLHSQTHRKLCSSFLEARTQNRGTAPEYSASIIDSSISSTQGLVTQLSPCRKPAVAYHNPSNSV